MKELWHGPYEVEQNGISTVEKGKIEAKRKTRGRFEVLKEWGNDLALLTEP